MNGSVELLRKRVVDDADEGFELVGKSERNGHVGEIVDEVGSAIDGIDYEGRGRRKTGGGRGRFFPQKSTHKPSIISLHKCFAAWFDSLRIVRISILERRAHHILNRFIRLRDQIRSFSNKYQQSYNPQNLSLSLLLLPLLLLIIPTEATEG